MLEQQQPRPRITIGLSLSLVLHLAVIVVLLYEPEPRLLQPSSALRGNGGGSHSVIALVAPGPSVTAPKPKKHEPLPEDRKSIALRSVPRPAPMPQQAPASVQSTKPGLPGYVLGSLTSGFVSEHDVRIAIPTLSPDPPIMRAKLPDWIRGDVIVEITISEEGAVTETKVLQAVGYGLEETILDTLRRWRFTPAVVDGIAVASRQDVHFHFPS